MPTAPTTLRNNRSRRQPRFEQLEPRAMFSADLLQNMFEEIIEQAPAVLPSVSYYQGLLRADGSFSDLNYKGNSDASAANLQQHGARLEVFSLAYKWDDPSNTYFNNPTLKATVLQGWNYLASKGGTVTAPNWWWKSIGVPQGMADGLILMRGEIPASVRNQILTKYFASDWTPQQLDGANLAYQAPTAMIDGLLRGDTNRIRNVVSKVSSELLAYSGEGIQRDLSFLQHRVGSKLSYYSGAYGLVVARDVSRVMRWASGTPYAFGTAAVDQQVRFVVDGLAWLTRGDALDIPSQGRSITRSGSSTNAPYVLNAALQDLVPLGRRTDELLAAIDRYENGISETNFLSGNKSFYKGDAIINQRPSLLTTVKLLSNRTTRPETAAGENTRGFFEGDGFTMFVQDGDEFGARGEPEIMPVWDWQRLPGTTVEHNGVIPYYDMFKTSTNSTGASSIAGSVSDGNYGLAAMDYRRSGVSVTAKKSWFFFDNEVIALGADIDDPGGAPVFTSLNQVLLDGPVTVQDAAGRRTLALGDSTSIAGQGWIEHDGLGYVLLDSSDQTTVQAQLQQSSSGLALPVFSAWVDHGVAPRNATYSYAVVPRINQDSLAAYSSNLPFKILANTSAVQAVQHVALQQTQIAFFAAGTVQLSDSLSITVNQPALLIVKQDAGNLVITAADPTQAAKTLTIDVSHRLAGPGVKWLPNGQTTRITWALPAAPYQGSSVTRTFTGLTGDSFAFPAVADASVRNGSYASKNYGGGTTLDIQKYASGNTREALLKFDATGINGDIVSAEVRLTAVAGSTAVTVAAAGVTDDTWGESQVTWNLKPLSSGQLGQANIKQGQTVAFDVTALVRAAAAGDGQFSLRLFSPTQTSYSVSLGSREQSNPGLRPVLEVLIRDHAANPEAEGEASARQDALFANLAMPASSITPAFSLASYLSSQRTVFLPPAPVSSPATVSPIATPRFALPTASSGKPGRGHSQPLNAAEVGPQAIDAVLGIWNSE